MNRVCRTPQEAFKGHVLGWAVGHGVLVGVFLYGLLTRQGSAILFACWGMAAWAPLIFSCGYLAVKRAWKGEPEDALIDVCSPAFAIIGVLGVAYLIAH